VLIGCLLVLSATRASAQDWPQWRGPHRDAKVTGFTAPQTWPKQLTQRWRVVVGEGVATPALVGDRLYVFTRQSGDEVTRCLNTADGKEIWQDKYSVQGVTGPSMSFPGPRSSPAVAEGKVVTLGVRGTLSCLDANTGTKVWRKDDIKGWPMFFTASSPIIAEGLCIAELGGRDNGTIVAYDLATGDQKWAWTGDGMAYASPVLMTVGGTNLVVTQTDKKMVAVTATDGKLVWEAPFAVQGRGYNAATPIVDGQTLIYTGSGRGVHAVKLDKEADKVVGKELWTNKDKSVMFSTPVLKDGLLYGLSQTNELFCLNAETGKTAWTAALGPASAGRPMAGGGGGRGGRGGRGGMRGGMRSSAGYGSIVDAGSVLLALTPSSELIVFQPSDQKYTELARLKVATTPTFAYPVVSGNRVFIKDQEAVTLWTLE
jgi:outer membrane protein assembly factor BamB